ncbi:antibiotic biosynthesis monooxygenase [Umezawaea endophytica]|uniref:Antibiotic biosynthesis monooxygenase n=1 Tax=Umezawaea endophytica TaxID=1654476 RepID=A0A9X3AEK0_9PSEU|nr:antibiotic biosynthesis monooxygenase [Umezawaea endophytica]MCS7475980.1 antibiotic biosynthesis monooxygenase [Umezawaea endophytica]
MPDLERADVDVVLVTSWTTDDPEAAVEKALAGEKPEGLLAASGYAELGGKTALVYEQWHGEPTERREGAVEYRMYRGLTQPNPPTVGCVVIVTAEFDGIANPQEWVDTVFDALETDKGPAPGGISAHFHLGTDGTRALNYAQWTSEAAHVAALENSGQGTVGLGEKWRRVKEFPGMTSGEFTRFRLVHEI